jgi:hypothetical protein
VGSNGDTLVADSSTSTGLRYQAPIQQNPILNSAMQVWQRGTTITGSSAAYGPDRWSAYRNQPGLTVSRQTTSDTTNLPFIQYCARVQRDNTNTSTDGIFFYQSMETVNSIPFVGKTVTLSFYARKGALYSSSASELGVRLNTGTGTDQNWASYTGGATAISQNAILTTSWQRFSYTSAAVIGTTVNELAVSFGFTPVGTAGATDYFEVTGVQLEVGSVATPFHTYAATIQGELAACQRYFNRFSSADYAYNNFSTGNVRQTGAGANSYFNFFYPVQMRIAPTAVTTANITSCRIQQGATDSTVTAAVFDGSTTKNGVLAAQATIATAGSGTLAANNNTNVTVDWSAEL